MHANPNPNFWLWTTLAAGFAVVTAAAGLLLASFLPALPSIATTALLLGSLAATTVAFGRIALRMRRMELENEGLVEEISQEFIRVKDKMDIFSEALDEPHQLTPEDVEADAPMRRVVVK